MRWCCLEEQEWPIHYAARKQRDHEPGTESKQTGAPVEKTDLVTGLHHVSLNNLH